MCVLVFVGQKWVLSCPLWFEIAFSAKNQKFTATSPSRLHTFRSRFAVFRIFMLIWSARCLALQDSHICLQSLIGQLAGQKQFLSLQPPPPIAQPHSFRVGSRGLGSQRSSQATGVRNSHLHYGRAFALFFPSPTLRRLPTIPNPMASWSGSTAVSRMLSAPGRPEQIGFYTFLGYC